MPRAQPADDPCQPLTQGEQAEILRLKAKVKDLQRELRNERECVRRAKAANRATHPTITRRSQLSRSHGFDWIDIPLGSMIDDWLFTMSTALTLEQESGSNTSYTLTGIVYACMGHFSARFMDASGRWWAYDGMTNFGQPSLSPITEDAQLTTLGDRAMHILLCRPDLPILPL